MSHTVDDGPTKKLTRLAQFFEQELDEVAFPGVDALAFAEAQREYSAALTEMTEAEQLVERARQTVQAQRASVASLVERAMAYLRVYAADDTELLAKLDELAPRRRGPSKGRRRKARPDADREGPTQVEPDVARAS